MNKLGKKSIGIVILGILLLGSAGYSLAAGEDVTTVHAASKGLNDATGRVRHLNWSLHNNYLGLKNQGQWQEYIKGIRKAIKTIPSSERRQAEALTNSVNRAEALVNALSRINQVEKSIASNTPRMGNVIQWNNYITLGKHDLSKVDKKEFSKEIATLTSRMEKCIDVITRVEEDFEKRFNDVSDLLYIAQDSGEKDDAWKVLKAAENLPSCEESDMIEYEARLLLSDMGEVKLSEDEIELREAYYLFMNSLEDSSFGVENTETSTIVKAVQDVVGRSINVNVIKVFSNPDTGEELFDIVLSKGKAKLYNIGVIFE